MILSHIYRYGRKAGMRAQIRNHLSFAGDHAVKDSLQYTFLVGYRTSHVRTRLVHFLHGLDHIEFVLLRRLI